MDLFSEPSAYLEVCRGEAYRFLLLLSDGSLNLFDKSIIKCSSALLLTAMKCSSLAEDCLLRVQSEISRVSDFTDGGFISREWSVDMSANWMLVLTFEERVFSLLSLFLALSHAYTSILPKFSDSETPSSEGFSYFGRNREWLRMIIRLLYEEDQTCPHWLMVVELEHATTMFMTDHGIINWSVNLTTLELGHELENISNKTQNLLASIESNESHTDLKKSVMSTVVRSLDVLIPGNRMPEMKHFTFESINPAQSMHITIAISGWLSKTDDMSEAWEQLRTYPMQGKTYALRWEASSSSELIQEDVSSLSLSMVACRVFPVLTIFNLVNLVKKEPFAKAVKSAEITGKALAKFLKKRVLGKGCVSLVGFSLGTTVIMHCMLELAKTSPGLLHNVILLGGAAPNNTDIWKQSKRAASGRLVNCFSTNDRVLSLLYRASQMTTAIGSKELNVPGVENYNLSELIDGHIKYRQNLTQVLKTIRYQP